MCKVLSQIKKDVPRTTATFKMEKFDFPFNSGMNPIFNILTAYAETDKQLGYTQGMNFLTALIFMATQDETITFAAL